MSSENPVCKHKNEPWITGHLDFLGTSILRYVGVFCVGFLNIGFNFLTFSFIFFRRFVVYLKPGSRLTCFCISLHFLQKYRCVPNIGFSADMFIGIVIDVCIDICIGIFIGILLTFC